MTFTSFAFAAFVALALAAYYLLPGRVRWVALLAASLAFYALSGGANLALMGVIWAITYGAGLLLSRSRARAAAALAAIPVGDKAERRALRESRRRRRFALLLFAISLEIAVFAAVKLNLFGAGELARRCNEAWHLNPNFAALSLLGLSFYTFQTIGYLIEVYRGKAPAERNPLRLGLFVSYFPLLPQGPICRYGEIYDQLFAPHKLRADNLRAGLVRVSYGLFKTYLIAARLGEIITRIAGDPATYRGPYFLLLTILYSAQIYANFTGGIDIARGVSLLFGIELPENFRQPFFSKSTKEYWKRWHITLGAWFTDYLFYPLSVCRPVLALTDFAKRRLGAGVARRLPVYLATILTWAATGLWHGLSPHFLVWGLCNCAVILVSQELTPLYRRFRARFPRLAGGRAYALFEMLRTSLLMGLIRVLDVYASVRTTAAQFASLFRPSAWRGLPSLSRLLTLSSLAPTDLVILVFALVLVAAVSARAYRGESIEISLRARPVLSLAASLALLTLTILFGRYGVGYDAAGFRYA